MRRASKPRGMRLSPYVAGRLRELLAESRAIDAEKAALLGDEAGEQFGDGIELVTIVQLAVNHERKELEAMRERARRAAKGSD